MVYRKKTNEFVLVSKQGASVTYKTMKTRVGIIPVGMARHINTALFTEYT